mmetsp:Transcript_35020/g.62439  ORF Transcript_35020/g.62439 Transcript_35020/m.62439 type:complete len:205 (-) Transcript_35020:619-1233(-)
MRFPKSRRRSRSPLLRRCQFGILRCQERVRSDWRRCCSSGSTGTVGSLRRGPPAEEWSDLVGRWTCLTWAIRESTGCGRTDRDARRYYLASPHRLMPWRYLTMSRASRYHSMTGPVCRCPLWLTVPPTIAAHLWPPVSAHTAGASTVEATATHCRNAHRRGTGTASPQHDRQPALLQVDPTPLPATSLPPRACRVNSRMSSQGS